MGNSFGEETLWLILVIPWIGELVSELERTLDLSPTPHSTAKDLSTQNSSRCLPKAPQLS